MFQSFYFKPPENGLRFVLGLCIYACCYVLAVLLLFALLGFKHLRLLMMLVGAIWSVPLVLYLTPQLIRLLWIWGASLVKSLIRLYAKQLVRRQKAFELKTNRYTVLSVFDKEIRLVAIMPGSPADPIECALKPISLDHRGHFISYEALSYTWGSLFRTRNILLDGEPCQVRENLYDGLKQLRLPDKVRFIWIDALSINQFDLIERGQQVSIMRYIYQNAYEVVVWLGEADKTSRLAFGFFELAEEQDDIKSFIEASIGDNKYQLYWQSIRILFKREYWQRIWIIQEIVTAPSITVQCGPDSVRWRTLVMCDALWKALTPTSIAKFPSWYQAVDKGEKGPLRIFNISEGPATLDTIRQNFQAFNRSQYDLVELMAGSSDSHNTIMELIQSSIAAKATDSRDYIYALIGLAADCKDPEFVIDYKLEPEEVYQSLVSYLKKKTGRIDLLGYSGEASIFEDRSWKMDSWLSTRVSAIHSKLQISRINTNDHFMADGNFAQASIEFQPAGYIARKSTLVSGCKVGTIWRLGPRSRNHSSSYFSDKDLKRVTNDIKDSFNFAKSMLIEVEKHRSTDSLICSRVRQNLQDFWRVLVCDRTIDGFKAPDEWEAKFISIIEDSPIDDFLDFVRPYQYAVLYYLNNRQLFITEDGDFGVGPLGVSVQHEKDKDDILILFGCNVPMARKKTWYSSSLKRRNRYTRDPTGDSLLSWVYLQNYMAGEVVGEIERGTREIRKFSFA